MISLGEKVTGAINTPMSAMEGNAKFHSEVGESENLLLGDFMDHQHRPWVESLCLDFDRESFSLNICRSVNITRRLGPDKKRQEIKTQLR